MKYAALLCLAASGFAQDLPAVSPLESFFRTVVTRSRITETPPANTVPPSTVQAAIGFSDSEMQSLNTIALAFVNRASAVRPPSGEQIFQARLYLADTGKESETFKQQIKQMNAELVEALFKATSQLRVALGDERFQQFDAWLKGGGATGCWVSPCSVAKL